MLIVRRLLLCCLWLWLLPAWASPVWSSENPPELTLDAPESVQGLLRTYFDWPDAPLVDDAAREVFMRRARLEVGELLATEGYFAPQLSLLPTEAGYQLRVETGPQAKVARFNLIFKGDLAASEPQRQAQVSALREAWPLQSGKPFRSAEWEQAKADLLSKVGAKRYALAQLAYSQADVDPEQHTVNLTLVLDSGPSFLFGDVLVEGLSRYELRLVERLRSFQVGEPYQRDKLLSFQTRLQSLPQFSTVRVFTLPDASAYESGSEFEGIPAALALPVQVSLTEMKARRLAVGVGYSSNNGARSELDFKDYHFLGQMWNMQGDMRLEQNRQLLSMNVDTLPDELDYVLSWGLVGETTLIEELETRRYKLSVARSRSRGQIERRLALNWQQEQQLQSSGVSSVNQALVLDWKWHRRNVDNPLDPRQGYSTELRLGGAAKALLSDQNFTRSYWRQQFWWPLGDNVLTLRSELAYTAANSREGIPQEYLFRVGGTQSVRGYDYLSLGVKQNNTVLGGRVMASGSAEYVYWPTHKWGAAAFVDVGDAADRPTDLDWAMGYGAGVRWRSPVGPLALDVAKGNLSPSWKLHFSIAVAF